MGVTSRVAAVCSIVLGSFTLAPALAGPPASAPYAVSVVQDGRAVPLAGVVHLRRAPFSLIFVGDKALAYEVVSTSGKPPLDAADLAGSLAAVFAPGGAAAEGQQDKFLVVNRRAAGAAAPLTFQYWWTSDRGDAPARLQTVSARPDGNVTSRRDIDEVLLDTGTGNDADIVIERFELTPIYVTVVARGDAPNAPVHDPTSATLVFGP